MAGCRAIIAEAADYPAGSVSKPQCTVLPRSSRPRSQRGFGRAPEVEMQRGLGCSASQLIASIADSHRIMVRDSGVPVRK